MVEADIQTMPANPSAVIRHLRRLVPNLGVESSEIIARQFQWQGYFPKGYEIIRQGEPGYAMYIIDDGRVAVTQNTLLVGRYIFVTNLSEGDIFGEMALILNQPRNANVIALEPTAVFRLSIDDWHTVTGRYPILGLKFEQIARERELNPNQLEPV